MKNITRTIRTLTVEFPVKGEKSFEARKENVIDMGAAAIRAELKKRCAAAGVKFLGEYEVVNVEEHMFSMPIQTFAEYADVID